MPLDHLLVSNHLQANHRKLMRCIPKTSLPKKKCTCGRGTWKNAHVIGIWSEINSRSHLKISSTDLEFDFTLCWTTRRDNVDWELWRWDQVASNASYQVKWCCWMMTVTPSTVEHPPGQIYLLHPMECIWKAHRAINPVFFFCFCLLWCTIYVL